MKKNLAITAVVLCALLFIPCLASAAQNCPLWLGTWEVKNADNSTRIWKIYESTTDTGSSVVLCKASGVSETKAGTDQVFFMILYISFTNTYSYTEETVFSQGMDSTEMDVNSKSDNFTSRPGGQYPVASGKKISSDVPPKPVITTTTTTAAATTTTTTTVADKPCPIAKTLGDNDQNVERLRDFRDSTLAKSAVGRRIIQIYYTNADSINEALERNPELRAVARQFFVAFTWVVGNKD
jgi:hypothetical protein